MLKLAQGKAWGKELAARPMIQPPNREPSQRGDFGMTLQDKTPEELAEEVESAVLKHAVPEVALAPFAKLLVRLSKDAKIATDKLQKTTDRLFWISVAILLLTFFLLVKEVFYYQHH